MDLAIAKAATNKKQLNEIFQFTVLTECRSKEEKTIECIIKKGLSEVPKHIPTWYIYDGSGSYFHKKAISESKNYYLHKADMELFSLYMEDILDFITFDCILVDYGCGDGIKSNQFIKGLLKRQKTLDFIPVDISEDILRSTCLSLKEEHGDTLHIKPQTMLVDGDTDILSHIRNNKLILCLCYLVNMSYDEQILFLSKMCGNMTERDVLLISADITTDEETVLKAYTPSSEFAEMFYCYALNRLNKDMLGNIDTRLFKLQREFVKDKSPNSLSYLKVWFECQETNNATLDTLDMALSFRENERVYLQNDKNNSGFSYKYTIEQIRFFCKQAGLKVTKIWTNANEHTAVCCLMKQYK